MQFLQTSLQKFRDGFAISNVAEGGKEGKMADKVRFIQCTQEDIKKMNEQEE